MCVVTWHDVCVVTWHDVCVVTWHDVWQVVEKGRHEELMAIENGTYRTLVGLQVRRCSGSSMSRPVCDEFGRRLGHRLSVRDGNGRQGARVYLISIIEVYLTHPHTK